MGSRSQILRDAVRFQPFFASAPPPRVEQGRLPSSDSDFAEAVSAVLPPSLFADLQASVLPAVGESPSSLDVVVPPCAASSPSLTAASVVDLDVQYSDLLAILGDFSEG